MGDLAELSQGGHEAPKSGMKTADIRGRSWRPGLGVWGGHGYRGKWQRKWQQA